MAVPMANDPPFATLNHFAADLGIPSESDLLRIGISSARSICSPSRAKPPRHNIGNLPIVPRIFLAQSSDCDVVDCCRRASRCESCRRSASIQALLLVGICFKSIFCTIPSSGGGARVQSDDHHVQANLPAAKTTTHTMRNRNIETAKLASFLNSLRPSLIRVVRRK